MNIILCAVPILNYCINGTLYMINDDVHVKKSNCEQNLLIIKIISFHAISKDQNYSVCVEDR